MSSRFFPLQLCFTQKILRNPTATEGIEQEDTAQTSPKDLTGRKNNSQKSLSCPRIIRWITAFCTITAVGVELRGFSPRFRFRTGVKMSKEKSQNRGVGNEQSTEDCFQVWLHFLRLPPTSTRMLIQCNLAFFWWLTPTEILPAHPRGGDGDGTGGRKWHPPKPVQESAHFEDNIWSAFYPCSWSFYFHKGRIGSRFRWLYRPISSQMGVDQINLPQLYFTNSLGRELCPVLIFCARPDMLSI